MNNLGKRKMQAKKKIVANIKKYYSYQFLNSLAFFSPVIVLFWQSKGLSMSQIMSLQSIYAVGVIILEIPTGALADYFGKKLALVLGSLFFALGLFWYGISAKFWQFAIGEVLCGTGMAFISGADRAFIHQVLKSLDREGDYSKVEGRARGLTKISASLGNLLGGFIGSISLGLTLITTGISTLIGFLIGLSFSETKEKLPREEKTEYIEIIRESIKIIGKNKNILWLVLFFAAFNGLVWTVNWYSQPYLQMLNVPIVYFGAIFAVFSLVSAFGSVSVYRFERLTKGKPFVIMSLTAILAMFLIGRYPSLIIFPLWSLFGALIIMNHTLVSDRILALIPAERASTILSFQNLIRRFFYALFGPILGIISDAYGIGTALQANALVLFVVLGILLFFKKKLRGETL